MTAQQLSRPIAPRMQAAIDELEGMILARYPETTFDEGEPDDHGVVYVRAIVDLDNPDEITEIVSDRQVDLLVEDGLAIYIIALRTTAREAAERQRQQADRRRFA